MCGWCSAAMTRASTWNRACGPAPAAPGGRRALQGHAAAQRDLLGLIDDPHSAPADLADDAELAQGRRRRPERVEVPEELEHGEDLGQDGGDLRIAAGQLGDVGGLP